MSYDDEDYFLPLEDQRVFGAGITRKRIPFVRSSNHDLSTLSTLTSTSTTSTSTPSTTGETIANKYLSIVLPKSSSTTPPPPQSQSQPPETETERSHSAPPQSKSNNPGQQTCPICALPITTATDSTKPHEASLAHQVCLTHSHPPSHLDRSRAGLRYLEAYGWDPDSRRGLGAPGREGIREPIKGRVKVDTVGLGAEEVLAERMKGKGKEEMGKGKGKVQKLNAKEVRRGVVEGRRRGEKLREMFYRDEDVLRYLGD